MMCTRMPMTVRFAAPLMIVISWCNSAGAQSALQSLEGQTMGTTYTVKIFDAPRLDTELRTRIDDVLRRVNEQMSTYLKSSEISRFNRSDSVDWFDVSSDTARVVDFALQVAKRSNGAFDVTIGPLVDAWGFGPGHRTGNLPRASQLSVVQQSIGFQYLDVRLDPPALKKQIPALNVDLSAIAKGHAVDRVVRVLDAAGVRNHFVEIGGEVSTCGSKAGQPWIVGIQLPDSLSGVTMFAHPMSRTGKRSIATSGDYRNYFEKDGQRYSHTIDPRTSSPVTHSLASVSVVALSCMRADAWATALNVLGPTDGLQLARAEKLDALLVRRTASGYETVGTGVFAEYSSPTVSGSRVGPNPSQLLSTGLMTTAVMALILMAMAVGVIFGRQAIRGSCGGLANPSNDNALTPCTLCRNPDQACQALRDSMDDRSQP